LAGGLLYTYLANTTTPTTTWSDVGGTSANANPVVLDSTGSATVRLDPAITYKFVLKDSGGATQWTEDYYQSSYLSQAAVGAALWPQTSAEVSASITPSNYAYPPGDVRRYGAKLDGTTNDTSAFQAAGLLLNPYAPAGSTVINGSIPIIANQVWVFDGTRINITGTTLKLFTATTVNDWQILGGLTVIGDNASDGSTSGTAAAIQISDCMRWRVEKITCKTIKGWGVLIQPGSSTSSRAEHGQLDHPQCIACYVGIEVQAGTGAEYCTVTSPMITRCATGFTLAAGNTNVIGGTITDNTSGMQVNNGSNHAHGIVTGVSINHSTGFNLTCTQVTNGQHFLDCHFFQASVWFDRSKGIVLDGGTIDCSVYNYKDGSSGMNYIKNMYCPGGYGFNRKNGSNNGHDQLVIMGCMGPDLYNTAGDTKPGVSINMPATIYVNAERAAASTQSLTSGVSATLIFPSVNQDWRGAYASGTGITTIPSTPVSEAGFYNIRCQLLFGGTAMSATASYVDVQVGGASKRLHFPTIYGPATKLNISFSDEIYLAAADTVTIVANITGTTPTFGDATWASSLEIERIA
jgi:hypothetical protein